MNDRACTQRVASGDSPLPPPLMTSEPGSFARKTIVERKPQIIAEVSAAYPYPPQIQETLAAFAREIAVEPIHPLEESAPDTALWNEAWAACRGRTWLEVPFPLSLFSRYP